MSYKTFISADGWYSMQLPVDWEEYEHEEAGTHAFFKAATWTGNLRITTLHWDNLAGADKASEIISEEFAEHEGAILVKVGEFDGVHYKEEFMENDEEMSSYCWIFGKNNSLFICSFSVDASTGVTELNPALNEVQDILRSIRVG